MKILNDAWELLGDKNRRAQYDRRIAEQESRQRENIIKHNAEQPTAHAQTYTYSHNPGQWKWESQPPPPGTGQGQGATKPKPEGNARKTTRTTQHYAPFHWPDLSPLKTIAVAMAVAYFAVIIIAFAATQTRTSPPHADASAAAPAEDNRPPWEIYGGAADQPEPAAPTAPDATAPRAKKSYSIDEFYGTAPTPAPSCPCLRGRGALPIRPASTSKGCRVFHLAAPSTI